MHLTSVPKLILLSDLREEGSRSWSPKGTKSKKTSVRLQSRKKEDVPNEIPKILYLHQNKKRGEIENNQ